MEISDGYQDDDDFANDTGSDDSYGNEFLSDGDMNCDDPDFNYAYNTDAVIAANCADNYGGNSVPKGSGNCATYDTVDFVNSDSNGVNVGASTSVCATSDMCPAVTYPADFNPDLAMFHKWAMDFVQLPPPVNDNGLMEATLNLIMRFGQLCENLTGPGVNLIIPQLKSKWDVLLTYTNSPSLDSLKCIYDIMQCLCVLTEKKLKSEFFKDFDTNLSKMLGTNIYNSKTKKSKEIKNKNKNSDTSKSSSKMSKAKSNVHATKTTDSHDKINLSTSDKIKPSNDLIPNTVAINSDNNLIIDSVPGTPPLVIKASKIDDISADSLNSVINGSNNIKITESSSPVKNNCNSGYKRPIDSTVLTNNNDSINANVVSKKQKPTVTAADFNNISIPTSNKFDVLKDCDNTNNNMDCNSNDVNNGSNNLGTDSANNVDIPPSWSARPEPITLKYRGNWREIAAKIDALCEIVIPKKVLKDTIKFFPKSVDAFRIIQDYFTKEKLEFYSMSIKADRPRKVVIKGIPRDFSTDEVKDELIKQKFNVHRVSKLKNWKTKEFMPIFLIDIFRNENFTKIYDLDIFMGFYVKVQAYQFRGTKQCYNCQRFNHSSFNCTFSPVCVKCAGAHASKDCLISGREGIKCANCGGNHTANFGGCSEFPKKKVKVPTIMNTHPATNINALRDTRRVVNKSSTYADMAKPNYSNNNKANGKINDSNNSINDVNNVNNSDEVTSANVDAYNLADFPPLGSSINNAPDNALIMNATNNNNLNVNSILNAPGLARLNFSELFSNLDKIDILIEKLEKVVFLCEKLEKFMNCENFSKLIPNLSNVVNSNNSGVVTP